MINQPPDAARARQHGLSVLACVDRSAYAASVCDHAAWLTGPLSAQLDVLHVDESPRDGRAARPLRRTDSVLRQARERLAEHGVQLRRMRLEHGDVAGAALNAAAAVTVLGKRGERSDGRRDALGSNAAALLRAGDGHLCLVSHIYLPLRRVLVLADSDPDHLRTVETVAAHPILSGLDLDVVVMDDGRADLDAKLARARARLAALRANVFPLPAPGPDAAAARRFDGQPADLIVMSREMLLAAPEAALLETRPIWAWRTPIYIC